MNKKVVSTKQLALVGILSALIMIMAYTPLGIIPIPGMAATILHIPVIIGAMLLGPKIGLILGGVMGIATMSRAWLMPTGPLDLFFRNPLVSILPRLFIGVIAYYVYKLIVNFVKKQYMSDLLASLCGAIANSILTLGTLMLIYYKPLNALAGEQLGMSAWALIGVILTTNAIGELLATGIIIPPIVANLRKVRKTEHVTSN
ncbi:MAG: ECF transporter S component [Cellulosilyticaceae bacterium]